MDKIDFASPWYPYPRVGYGYNTMRGAEEIPGKLLRYLMDLPDASGYEPEDDNERPRVRLMKYLFYDGPRPLSKPLPTADEKRSLYFDGTGPAVNTDDEKEEHPQGYRLFCQQFWLPAVYDAKTVIKCYIGKVTPWNPYNTSIGITFEIVVNYGNDNNLRTTAYSRLWAMECALVEALHGVNITGVGVIDFNRGAHSDAGSRAYHDDGTHILRFVNFSVQWSESTPAEGSIIGDFEN